MSELNPYKQQASKSVQEFIQEIALLKLRIASLEEQLRWIPVEEILPKDEKEVLVRTSDGNMWIDLYGIWGDENTASWGDDNVTHWMPLPQPPEVKNE